MLLRRDRDAGPQVLDVFEIQFVGDAEDDVQEFRVREGGVQLANGPDDAFVAQVLQGEVHEVEVDALEEHPGGGMDLPALVRRIGQARDGMISREAIELVYRLYFSDVRKGFGHTYRSWKITGKV